MWNTLLHTVKMITVLFYEHLQCIHKTWILIEKTAFAERLTSNFSGKKKASISFT